MAFITDPHLDQSFPKDRLVDARQHFERALEDIRTRGITQVVFGGDIGAVRSYPYFFNRLRQFDHHIILGNHDAYDQVRPYFEKGPDPEALYYVMDRYGYRMFFLDSSKAHIGERQLDWFKKRSRTDLPLLIFVHHPILPIPTPMDTRYVWDNREAVRKILVEQNRPVTAFCGHYHMADDSIMGNIRQVVTPALSFQIVKEAPDLVFDNSRFGYHILKFGTGGLLPTYIDLSLPA